MKRLMIVLLMLVLFSFNPTPTPAQPAELRSFLPSVSQLAQGPATMTVLSDQDCGFVSVTMDPVNGLPIVAYIIRPNGNLLHVAWDMGDHLVELPDPSFALTQLHMGESSAPGFVYPGPKQGTGALLVRGNMLSVYATSRQKDTGPFMLTRLDMPIPKAP